MNHDPVFFCTVVRAALASDNSALYMGAHVAYKFDPAPRIFNTDDIQILRRTAPGIFVRVGVNVFHSALGLSGVWPGKRDVPDAIEISFPDGFITANWLGDGDALVAVIHSGVVAYNAVRVMLMCLTGCHNILFTEKKDV
jgi:hypothetical protein